MTQHLYALIVGINEYADPACVPSLKGCINDAKAMEAYLKAQVADGKTQLHIRTLTNEQATRQAVIDGFRDHLQQAKANDSVLFYYAGHGSQNKAPEEFWPISPNRLNETLVCYDSRTSSSMDLTDKELAKLIAEVGEHGPHIAIVLDCCHSGSGTRSEQPATFSTRKAPIDERDHSADSFLVSAQEMQQIKMQADSTPDTTRSARLPVTGWTLPQHPHVLLAACRDIEEAREYQVDGRPCGVFSHFLLDTLQKATSPLSYRDLFNAIAAKTRVNVSGQSPQLESPYPEDLNKPFLGGLVTPFPPYFTLTHSPDIGWCINGGAIHGIQHPSDSETAQLAVFPVDVSAEALTQLKSSIAIATVTGVEPQFSIVTTNAALDTNTTYKAVITYLPIPPLRVSLEGDPTQIGALRQAIQAPEATAASYLQEVTEDRARVRLVAGKSGYTLLPLQAGHKPIAITEDNIRFQGTNTTEIALRSLAHIARWTSLAELTPPRSNQLPADAVELQIYQGDRLLKEASLQLQYERHNQRWRSPRFKAKLINHTHRPLYCAIFSLTEEYSISAPFFSSGGIWLDAHSEIFATVATNGHLSDQIVTKIPQRLLENGVSEYRDTLKLVASTVEFDPRVLLQGKLDEGAVIARRSISATKRGLFGQFSSRKASRDIGTAEDVALVEQWMTSQRVITTMRPTSQPAFPISSESTLSLNLDHREQSGEAIAILPHSQLQANARLVSTHQSARSLSTPALPPLLKEHTHPLSFTTRRSGTSSTGTLELSDIHNAAAVTPNYPLTLVIDAQLAPGESVLPVAHDGEFFVPLGYSYRDGHKTKIVLQRLPQVVDSTLSKSGTRTISSALQIVFRKVATQTLGDSLSQKLGIDYEYPILTAVEKGTRKGELNHTADTEEIRTLVANASSIAVYIHGITDSTQSMLPSLQNDCITIENRTCSVSDVYDLVLTYDYESVNTSIADSALQLKQKLATVGIVPGHQKTVHIIAHSMGGLVSRWLIEEEGGNEIIQHLIMLGTPNAGSPWPVVQAGLFQALSYAINGLSTVAWPLQLIGGVLRTLEKIDIALDEMNPGSETLARLAANEPPIPYSIVAGNTNLISADSNATLRTRLKRKIDKLAEFPFLKEDNDIAVSVSSICHVPAGSVHIPAIRIVACNHLVYFVDPIGLAGLSWAINRAFQSKEVLQAIST